MDFKQSKEEIFVAPIVFGPIPDNITEKKSEHVKRFQIIYTVDEEKLETLIPEMFRLTEPCIIIEVESLSRAAWLGGRSYNRVSIRVPVSLDGRIGLFNMVTWEDNGDSIILGRDILGIPKMYAQINWEDDGNKVITTLKNWGFEYLRISLSPCTSNEQQAWDAADKGDSIFNYRFLPRTAKPFNLSDAEYITASLNERQDPSRRMLCEADVVWNYPQFEDTPTQYYFIQKLAQLSPQKYIEAYSEEFDRKNAYMDQEIVWEVK